MQVERATHSADDRRQPVHLALARPVLLVDVVEVPASDRSSESLGHVLDPALGESDDLVVVRFALDGARQQLDRDTPIYGQHIDECVERQSLRGLKASVVARSMLVLRPWRLEVGAKGGKHPQDESGGAGYEALARWMG